MVALKKITLIQNTGNGLFHALDGLGWVKTDYLGRQYKKKTAKAVIELHEKNGVWKKGQMKPYKTKI